MGTATTKASHTINHIDDSTFEMDGKIYPTLAAALNACGFKPRTDRKPRDMSKRFCLSTYHAG